MDIRDEREIMSLTKEQILNSQDLTKEKIEVPEWGGVIFVRTMTGAERDSFEQGIVNDDRTANLSNIRAKLCALTVIDEEGKRIFTDDDVKGIGEKSSLVLDRVFQVAQKLNGISPADVEDLAKNSEETQGEDFVSD